MLYGQGKRCRGEDADADEHMTIEADEIIPDTLKRIRLGGPTEPVGWDIRSLCDKIGEGKHEKNDTLPPGNIRATEFGPYLPAHPLRRPRSQLDESIDNIIRKSRRRFESSMNSEYVNLQMIPLGPDPLIDARLLGHPRIVDKKGCLSSSDLDEALWPVEGRHPNVYNFVRDANVSAKIGRSRSNSNTGSMDISGEHDSFHFANDISHSDWIISFEPDRVDSSETGGNVLADNGSMLLES